MVVNVLDKEVGFGSLIGRAQVMGAEQLASSFGGLDVEAVVADKAEDFAVAVDGVVAEHFAGSDFACLGALVGNVLHKVGVACHNN